MTVLIVPSWYKTDSNPILGSFFYEQAKMLNDAGIKAIVADATFQGREDYFSKRCFRLKKTNDEGVLTYSLVEPGFRAFKKEDGGIQRYYKNIRRIFNELVADGYHIELIHAHSYLPAGVAAVKLGKEENIPVIVTEHSSGVLEKELTPYRVQLLENVVNSSKAFICVSEALKRVVKELVPNGAEPVVIPNPVNKDFTFKNVEKNEQFTFVSIGNLVESKRFDLTIKAFSNAFAGKQDKRLVILGDGILRKELEILAKTYHVEKQVIFEGRVSRKTVSDVLAKSHVFVLPSDYETFGIVYVEAMACGLPVIGTRNGGAEDIITEDNGYLIEKNNLGQLTQAMKCAYKDYAEFYPEKIAWECQKRFGQDQIIASILDVYKQCMEQQLLMDV